MKIIICPDSFKGSLGAEEVTSVIAEEIKKNFMEYSCDNVEIIELPLADGGEGTAGLLNFLYPIKHKIRAHSASGELIETQFHSDVTGEKVFIESAEIIGLPLVALENRNPLNTSSFGLGEVISAAAKQGVKEIAVALGGSATCDGGMGMLESLGDLKSYGNLRFRVICDVENPLLGEKGAVMTYGLQKGAKETDLPILEERMKQFAETAIKKGYATTGDICKRGAGAAGGLGFTFFTYLKAEYYKGIDFILDQKGFDKIIRDADIIITGEGKIDRQSLMGKVVGGVLARSQQFNIPVIAIGGKIEDRDQLHKAGLINLHEIADPDLSLLENMKREVAIDNIRKCIRKLSPGLLENPI